MSTSADPRHRLRVTVRAYDHPDSVVLIEALQQEYRAVYGDADHTPVDPGEFAEPHGLFLVAYDEAGAPVGSGGWRRHEDAPDAVEIKRMYVVPAARARGVARLLVGELERTALDAGASRVVLMTGGPQRAAVALYAACGYRPAPPYGFYADAEHYPDALFYDKRL